MPVSNDPILTVMTIAGFDPSGGAGLVADVKTISAFGCYAVGVITSITEQNTLGISAVHHQARHIVHGQMQSLFEDFDIAAVKIGMLPTADTVEEVVESLSARDVKTIVVDPVMKSSSGYDLVNDDAVEAMVRRLFPLASVITPNSAEAGRIVGIDLANRVSAERAGRSLVSLGARAVVVTGGDNGNDSVSDLVVDEIGSVWFSGERVDSTATHGTGCVFSSAVACLLAQGHTLREAVPIAKKYIVEGIRTAPGLGRGRGPINPFPAYVAGRQ